MHYSEDYRIMEPQSSPRRKKVLPNNKHFLLSDPPYLTDENKQEEIGLVEQSVS